MRTKQLAFCALAVPALLGLASAALAGWPAKHRFSDWDVAMPVTEINSAAADGCPIESPDGLSVYIASTRSDTGALGANDIWAADRASKEDPFGAPEHLGTPVNSTASDFCPTPLDGRFPRGCRPARRRWASDPHPALGCGRRGCRAACRPA